MKSRYRHLNEYYKEKFGERVLKICVNAGFTCPNRDGTCGTGGCIFCSEKGSGDHLNFQNDIPQQVKDFLNSHRGQRANKFIVYFQNFTNTYDTIENLKKKYDSALIDDRIIGMAIDTRPDCINENVVNLIKSYAKNYYIMVELGLQTSNDKTGKLINRGYTSDDFTKAVKLLNEAEIDVVAHIMVGLPGESNQDIQNTVTFLNAYNIQGLKIHSTYVVKDTVLAQMYENGEYFPITLEDYIKNVAYILTHISPQIVIHRISGDAPKESLLAPDWNLHKKWILNGIEKTLKEKNLWQGKYF